jgi:hypothetical protein
VEDQRAAEHWRVIQSSVDGFLEKVPQPYRVDVRDDELTRERSWWLEVVEQPPAVEWAGITGELLHNLRSALDHLAFALCLAHAPETEPPRQTKFPIFWEKRRFEDTGRGGGLYKLAGMSPGMQEAIRAEQPFSLSEGAPKTQSIWLLQQMSNIDKHRTLNLAVIPGGMTMTAWFEDPQVEMNFILSPEGEIARARPRTPDAVVRTEPVFKPQVVFDEVAGPGKDRPTDVQLSTFVRVVSQIVGRLANRFLGEPLDEHGNLARLSKDRA